MDLPSAEGRALCGLCWRVWEVTAAAGARKPNFSSLFVYLFICCFRSWFQCLTLQVRGERCYGLQPSAHLYITAGRTAGSCRSRRCHQDFSLFETLRFQVRFLNQQSRCFISVPGRCSCWQESPPLDYYQTLWSGLLLWITAAAPSHSTSSCLQEGDPTGSLLRAHPPGDLKEPLHPQIKLL